MGGDRLAHGLYICLDLVNMVMNIWVPIMQGTS